MRPELMIGWRPEPESSRARTTRLPGDVDDGHDMTFGRPRLARMILRLDADLVVRDHDLVVVTQRLGLLQTNAVDVRAVVRAEILERPAFAVAPQTRVLTRHAHVGDEDLAVRTPANDVFAVA